MTITADDLMKMFAERFEITAALEPPLRAMAEAVIELAAEAAAEEREACAKIIDDNIEGVDGIGRRTLHPRHKGNLVGTAYADAIRARGKP